LDLGTNAIADLEVLATFKNVSTLKILNILGNPLSSRGGLKR